MAAAKKMRLFKIASEINIGKDTIVDFLTSKGFDISVKPTSVLTPEMIEAVYDKFKKEKRAAEVQREKLEKHKVIRKPTPEEEKAEKAKATPPELPQKKEPEAKAEPEKPAPVEEKKVEVVAKPEKIDLEKKAVKAEPKIEKAKETREEKPIEKVAEKEKKKVKEEKPPSAKAKKVKPAEKPKEKPAEKPKEKPAEKPKEKPETKTKKKTEEKEKKVEQEAAEEKAVETGKVKPESKSRKRKKIKKLVEIDLDSDENNHLRGLKVVGKIDLKKGKEKREKTKKKKAIEEEEKAKPKTRKARKKTEPKEIDIHAEPKKPKEEKKKRKRKKSIREQIKQEDVDRAIKETLAGMGSHHTGTSRAKIRQKKKAEREEKELKLSEEKEKEEKILKLTEYVTTSDLANLMDVTPNDVILKCMQLGLMVTINQRLDKDTITLIADDYGFEVEFVDEKAFHIVEEDIEDKEEDLKPRSPIVTIMGHVDHGKTSLLDFIRHTNVVAGEAGGITQHIAAYKVKMQNNKSITFLDTPGHEAFTAMRARGAQVTDIVVLIVAADDSVMPQTIEAISHAQAAKVPIVVAINKIDKPDANPDRIKQQLADHNILVEDWGGTYQSVEISAKKGTNVDKLLETILLEAEMLELKANPDRKARGTVIESHLEKGLGAVATVIVQKGTLSVGSPFVSGIHFGRVRLMMDERGEKVKLAGPSIPVGVIGFDGLPEAGDILVSTDSDSEARQIAIERQQLRREQDLRQVRLKTLDDISKQIQLGGVKDLFLLIKGDVAGSVEALSDSLLKLSREEVRVSILHKGVGTIKESDVMLASASDAIIIGFNIGATAQAKKAAENEAVEIRYYDIIYQCINDVQLALEGLLTPDIKEETTSSVEVRKVFKISKIGHVAGCYVKSGKITRNDKVRVLRDGLEVFNGTIQSLKREKDDVREVDQGYECGIQLDGFNDVKTDDIIESYKLIEVKRTLD